MQERPWPRWVLAASTHRGQGRSTEKDSSPWRHEFSVEQLKSVVAYVLSREFPN